jgi:probable HAF family extracellular repeat protein
MLRTIVVPLIAGGLLTVAPPSHAEIRYALMDLGTPGSGSPIQPMGLNNLGEVVGSVLMFNPVFAQRSFLFAAGSVRELSGPLGAPSTVIAINNRSVAAGKFAAGLFSPPSAATWSGATPTPLALPAGADSAAANTVNNHGTVAGYGSFGASGQRAVVWDAAGSPTVLEQPGDFAGSTASAIDDFGVITGTALRAENGTGDFNETHIVRWTNGQFADLGAVECIVRGANAAGQILCNAGGPAGLQSFVYSGGMSTVLPLPDGFSGAAGQGINAAGEIVGSAFGNGSHAVFWKDGTVTDLNTLIDPSSGWLLTTGGAINDAGQIAAWGTLNGGNPHALLLTPVPEPGSVALLCAGLSALLVAIASRRVRAQRSPSRWAPPRTSPVNTTPPRASAAAGTRPRC